MELKAYKDWGIFTKTMSLSVLTWLVLVLATMFALVPFKREQRGPYAAEISRNIF